MPIMPPQQQMPPQDGVDRSGPPQPEPAGGPPVAGMESAPPSQEEEEARAKDEYDRIRETKKAFGDTADPNAPETDEDGNELATEEEEEAYELLVTRAGKALYGDSKESILRMLGDSERPSKGMGKVATLLIQGMMEASKSKGREITEVVALHAATEVIEMLNELAMSEGIFQYEDEAEEQQEADDAMLWGAKFYGDNLIESGELTPEKQKKAQAIMNAGIQADIEAGHEFKGGVRGAVKEGIATQRMEANAPKDGVINSLQENGVM